jgi:hypothetical protein
MKLYDELYFEITLKGQKSELVKFIRFLKSGELDDFFDVVDDYIVPADEYADASDEEKTEITFTNDDIGIEIDRFNPEDFLDVFCLAAKKLDVRGHFYDINDEEYEFSSIAGDNGYTDSILQDFNDELDSYARDEDVDDEDEE